MMRLYSGIVCPFSHRCRIVLHAKNMEFEIRDVDIYNKPPELMELNPRNEVPVLVDRDLVLFESNIINEYLDERFPHPQLMPADPSLRAQSRLMLNRLEEEVFSHVKVLEDINAEKDKKKKATENIVKALLGFSSTFEKRKFALGDEISLVDIAIAPLLWRLDHYGIKMGREVAPLLKYAERIFQNDYFINSLTASEKAMRR